MCLLYAHEANMTVEKIILNEGGAYGNVVQWMMSIGMSRQIDY